MIDFGLSKLMLVGVVALVVIGPEKLPRVARMAGSLFGRAQRYINQVKSEVRREMDLDELRKMRKDMTDAVTDVEQTIHQNFSEVKTDLVSAWEDPTQGDDQMSPSLATPSADQLAMKARTFRKKKLAGNSALPAWFKRQSSHKTRVISGAARVAKYRPTGHSKPSSYFL
jgi:sec-independent protein translocase protein TatB